MYKIYQIKLHDKGYSVDSNITEQANIAKTCYLDFKQCSCAESLLAEKDFNFVVTNNMC